MTRSFPNNDAQPLPRSRAGRGAPPWSTTAIAIAILVAGAWLVFVLPWRMPVPSGIESVSAVAGFSNRAALAGVAATLMALLVTRVVGAPRPPAGPLLDQPARGTGAERATLAVCGVCSAAVIGGWWWWMPSSYFGESAYFLTRLDMMTLGLGPYRDFDYGYGPALLVVPMALHRMTAGFIPLDTAYVATVMAHAALGLLATAAMLRHLAADPRVRIAILIFVAAASVNITMGVIYSPLRFVYAAWAALASERTSRRGGTAGIVGSLLLSLGGWLLSPEVGMATLASLVVGIVFRHGLTVVAGRQFLAVVAAPAALLAIHGWNLLGLLSKFGGGALNFPIFPTPSVVALLGCAYAVLPALGTAALRRREDRSASLAVALGMAIPPALGRCDPGHILLNGLPLVVVALAWSWWSRDTFRRAAAITAALTMLVTHGIGFWNHYRHLVAAEAAMKSNLEENAGLARRSDQTVMKAILPQPRDWGWAKRSPFPTAYLELLRFEALATPLATTEDLDRFLKMSGRYVPGYHVPPASGLIDEAAAERVARDATACEHIMVPSQFVPPAPPTIDRRAYRKGMEGFLSGLFVFPVSFDVVNTPWNGAEAVMRRVRESHAPFATFAEWTILARRPVPQPPPGR